LSVLVFLGEIYGGYKEDDEIKADNLAISYLRKAGFNSEALVSVFKKLLKLRNEYISKDYVSHLLVAKPGLEERIENANQVIRKYY
jgi:predicted Zn-dependent protease